MVYKKIFYIGVIVLMGCSSKKGRIVQPSIHLDTIPEFGNITVERVSPSAIFSILLDSANRFKPQDPIPNFFYNHLLDYENPWLTDHNNYSLRKLIIDSTNNKELLKAILLSNDIRLKKIIDSGEVAIVSLLNALPYRNFSNYQMANMKIKKTY